MFSPFSLTSEIHTHFLDILYINRETEQQLQSKFMSFFVCLQGYYFDCALKNQPGSN